jgi:hypothetical protein
MDPIVLIIVIAIGTPLAVIWALAKSAQLRGPAPRPESRRRVGSLVTQAIPEEHPDETDDEESGPEFSIDSPPPEPDPDLRERSD